MRKRYTRKYRCWSPRFKWGAKDFALLIEFEREWKGHKGRQSRPRDDPKGR